MGRKIKYKTKQKELVLQYLVKNKGKNITADDILKHFNKQVTKIGKTTVYRHLDSLLEENVIKKYFLEDSKSSYYQYIENNKCIEHYHLRCDTCGHLFHLDCGFFEDMQNHLSADHKFNIDPLKTVIYGKCNTCTRR